MTSPASRSPASQSPAERMTAFFENRADAERAIERLRAADVPGSRVRLTEGTAPEARDPGGSKGPGFFEALGEFFMPEPDREAYAEGLSRGGHLVTVEDVPLDRRDAVARLLREAGAVDIGERAASWRAEGWTGIGRELTRRADAAAPVSAPPRPVQPGFADAAPGLIPDPAPLSTPNRGEPRGPSDAPEAKGRFADQLDHLPDETRDAPRRARD